MKRIFLSITVVIVMVFTGQAQMRITPKAGYVASTWSMSSLVKEQYFEVEKVKFISGFAVGAAFEISLTDIFSLQPEVLYSQKGFKGTGLYDDGERTGTYSKTFQLNYVEVPVLFKASFGKEDGLRFFGYFGSYLGYTFNGKQKYEISSGNIKFSQTVKIKFEDRESSLEEIYYSNDEVNRLDLGVYAGAGVSLPVGIGAISLETRFGYGLGDFYRDTSPFYGNENLKSQTRTISAFIGYSLPLKGK
ncbi:porin family protein [Cytophagaceae bacterium DM2B3-1]|uniref:Porin family protein n=1 Tax=Xanthocytophaga flava TaxID=3048013 RepID=A0ABT7CNY7_9BACT|nr:porin family protein [Xanthocytophaga flavus]MDJ1467626.1 porin family protein [Xanthocytophaga flavus]MDJ1494720.1 porin family protein [Xanthocytophaga flavus]